MLLTFVDNALEANDGKQSTGDGGCSNGAQNDDSQQTAGVASGLALEKDTRGRRLGLGRGGHGGLVSRKECRGVVVVFGQ